MIKVEKLTFSYGDDSPILNDISLIIDEPTITCLWGKNGSGKTTLMKLLSGYLKPTKGTVKIMDHEPYNNIKATENICYMQEDHPFSSIWNVQDALRFGSYFYKNWDQSIAEELIDVFKLPRKKKIAKLSKGMKSALQIVIGISSFAEITILDEPTNGLDAAFRKTFYKVLNDTYGEHPRLILISTHHIEEIQSLCESLVLIDDHNILLHQAIDDVKAQGVWLAGEKELINAFVKGHKILEEVTMGRKTRVMVDMTYSEELKLQAKEAGISIDKAHLQDYLLNITEKREAFQ